MFNKTWKQLKVLLILIIIVICLPHSFLPHKTGEGKNDFDFYKSQNDKEVRLIGYKDDDDALKLKLEQIGYINKSRKKNNAPPVKLDILASRVANKMAKEAAENEFLGHWNLAGEEPYMRYSFAGGYDHVSENAYGEWSSENYTVSNQAIASMMKAGHDSFMSEKAPANGHKINIIEKSHNYAGIGYFLKGKQFRYYEEFIDRYFDFKDIPREVKAGDEFKITVKPHDGNYLYYMVIYRQKFPVPLSAAEINSRGGYKDYTDVQYKEMTAWDLARFRFGTNYVIPLKFNEEGLYYIHIYADKKEITKPGTLTTKGKIPASGIIIKVNF